MNSQDNENKGNKQGKKRAIITTIIIVIIIIIILLLRSCGTGNSQPSTKEPDSPIGNFEVGDKQETEKPSTTPSGVSLSCFAYPFTVFTKLGTRSARR